MGEGNPRPRVLIVDDTRFDREVAVDAIGDAARIETAGMRGGRTSKRCASLRSIWSSPISSPRTSRASSS